MLGFISFKNELLPFNPNTQIIQAINTVIGTHPKDKARRISATISVRTPNSTWTDTDEPIMVQKTFAEHGLAQPNPPMRCVTIRYMTKGA